jgi:hypothetical protein
MAVTGTITIDDALWEEMKDAYAAKWSIPLNSQGSPLFTKVQWVMECHRRMAKRVMKDYRHHTAMSTVSVTDIEEGIT